MKRVIILLFVSIITLKGAIADEGMWLMPFISKANMKQMKGKGLKLSLEELQKIKESVVIFGGGCTGEIVSADGLLLTNHHCGYGAIQQHSTVENDYLKNGFWAMNRAEEIPTPGLTVTFIRDVVDVTDRILPKLSSDTISGDARKTEISDLIKKLTDKNIIIKDFFGGNQYIMFTLEVFKDIRIVGAPPSSIGKFGGETDNWMWPRHTGDFSVFRVYADKNGKPTEYSKDNTPLNCKNHLKISLKGITPGDFSMIVGFPGTTNRYMSSYEIDQVLNQDNPNRILVRGVRQDIMKKAMSASDEIRIKYSSKYASSSNYWKNSIGMSRGLKRLGVKDKKIAIEQEFLKHNPSKALDLKKSGVEGRMSHYHVVQYTNETLLRGIDLISAYAYVKDSANLRQNMNKFYKDYDAGLDREIAKAMFKLFRENVKEEMQPDIFKNGVDVDYIFNNSMLVDSVKFNTFMDNYSMDSLKKDPGYKAYKSIVDNYNKYVKEYTLYQNITQDGHRMFIAGLMKTNHGKEFYPDANFTQRLTYGQVLPYKPADGILYDYYTTLSGIMDKEDALNSEFTVPLKLKELYKAKDFSDYAYKGDIPVAFISNNDITGGNSGSPVMNKRGELIGLAFDGNWEAMSGDIAFEPELQRTISVDIRYVLFIIDKYAGAGYLLNEMTIVR